MEVLVSITCGSAPVVKPFFLRYLPGLFGVSVGSGGRGKPVSEGGSGGVRLCWCR